jgi:hypothetical protein
MNAESARGEASQGGLRFWQGESGVLCPHGLPDHGKVTNS